MDRPTRPGRGSGSLGNPLSSTSRPAAFAPPDGSALDWQGVRAEKVRRIMGAVARLETAD